MKKIFDKGYTGKDYGWIPSNQDPEGEEGVDRMVSMTLRLRIRMRLRRVFFENKGE
jgi:hypothetical protein